MKTRERGFSVADTMIGVAIIALVSSFPAVAIHGTMQRSQANAGIGLVVGQMRLARQLAITDRRVFVLTLANPQSISMVRQNPDGTATAISTLPLPPGVQFRCEPGIPTTTPTTPDHFGIGNLAADFNGGNAVYFQTDGAARDAQGRINNGVVYIAEPGTLATARAATLFGSTGRIKAWTIGQYTPGSSAWTWK